jgi:hypothetical protein
MMINDGQFDRFRVISLKTFDKVLNRGFWIENQTASASIWYHALPPEKRRNARTVFSDVLNPSWMRDKSWAQSQTRQTIVTRLIGLADMMISNKRRQPMNSDAVARITSPFAWAND